MNAELSAAQMAELTALIEALLDERITSKDAVRLDQHIRRDEAARWVYVQYTNLYAGLCWDRGSRRDPHADNEPPHVATPVSAPLYDLVRTGEETSVAFRSAKAAFFRGAKGDTPTVIDSPVLSGALQSFFASGWAFAYLIATVTLGLGLLIGSLTPVSDSIPIAHRRLLPAESPRQPDAAPVGLITGMVDCQFAEGSGFRVQSSGRRGDGSELPSPAGRGAGGEGGSDGIHPSSFILHPSTPVSLGDKFALTSGLLQITYDTGAKVILQGPVSYEVESKDGGYLSLGKLTARVAKNDECGMMNDELQAEKNDIHHSSFITHHLFSVRTPTATVTDLGTEFGVEVGNDGQTEVHVLQGIVEARLAGVAGSVLPPQRLTEGCAVEILPNASQIKAVAFAPQAFTRKLQFATDTRAEAAYIKAVLADRPMGYWPLNEPVGARKFQDRSDNGFHGRAMKKLQAGVAGPLQDGRAVLLKGDGYIDVGRHDEFALAHDFTVEAWVSIDRMEWLGRILSVASDRRGEPAAFDGWAVSAQRQGRPGEIKPVRVLFSMYGDTIRDFLVPGNIVPENGWAHLVVAFDRSNTIHLYVNGEHCQSIQGKELRRPESVWVSIGAEPGFRDLQPWRGRLAHVAVYPRVLNARQIRNHYNQGKGSNGSPSARTIEKGGDAIRN